MTQNAVMIYIFITMFEVICFISLVILFYKILQITLQIRSYVFGLSFIILCFNKLKYFSILLVSGWKENVYFYHYKNVIV